MFITLFHIIFQSENLFRRVWIRNRSSYCIFAFHASLCFLFSFFFFLFLLDAVILAPGSDSFLEAGTFDISFIYDNDECAIMLDGKTSQS